MLKRIVVLIVVALLPVIAKAQPLAERLPEDTVLYGGWGGIEFHGAAYDQSHLKAVLDSSNFREVFTEMLPKVFDKIAAQSGNPDADEVTGFVKAMVTVYKRPFAYAFTGVQWKDGNPMPRFVFISDSGPDAPAVEKMIKAVIEKEPSFKQIAPAVLREGNIVLLAIGYDTPQDLLKLNGGAGSLAAKASFKASMAQVGKDPIAAMWIDVAAGIKLIDTAVQKENDPQANEMWPKVRDALGITGVRHIAYSDGFDGKDWGTQLFIDAPGPRKGLLALLDAKPVSDNALKSIPADATLAGVGRFDAAKLVTIIKQIVRDIDASKADQIDGMLAQTRDQLGVDIEKDLIGAMGDEWIYYSSTTINGQGLLGVVMANTVRDPAKLEQSLAKLEQIVNAVIAENIPNKELTIASKEKTIDGIKVHYFATPLLAPAYAIKGDKIYFAFYPELAIAAAKNADGGKSILDNPQFTALRDRMGVKNASGITYADLRATIPLNYSSWLMISRVVGFADLFGVDSPILILPPLKVILEHANPAGGVSWVDEGGWHFKSIMPFPGATVLANDPISQFMATYFSVMPSILLPALSEAREQANQAKSKSNLSQIGKSCIMYAHENTTKGGPFPDSLAQLYETQDSLTPDVFLNPRTNSVRPPPNLDRKEVAEWLEENSDYVYVGKGLTYVAGATDIVAYEKPDGLRSGINILYADGHVEFHPMHVAMQKINELQQKRNAPKDEGGL